jgi:hypothetical protein
MATNQLYIQKPTTEQQNNLKSATALSNKIPSATVTGATSSQGYFSPAQATVKPTQQTYVNTWSQPGTQPAAQPVAQNPAQPMAQATQKAPAPATNTSGSTPTPDWQNPVIKTDEQIAKEKASTRQPWENESGFNRSYIPSQADLANPNLTDYQRNILSANFYNSQTSGSKIDTSGMPLTEVEEIQGAMEEQQKQKSALDEQIDFQKAQVQQKTSAAKAGVTASFAQDREGAMSTGNTMAAGQITKNMGAAAQNQLHSLEEMQRQQQAAMQNGNSKLAASLGQSIASQQQKLQASLKEAQDQSLNIVNQLNSAGVLAGADAETLQAFSDQYGISVPVLEAYSKAATKASGSKEQQQQFDNQTKALATFKDLVSNGTPVTLSLARQFSESTGLPIDALLGFNETAGVIMGDKTLSNEQKLQAIQKESYSLDQLSQGIFTKEAQNVDYLKQLYKQGADPSMISAFKNAAGITDYNDPMTQADLAYKRAQTAYSQSQTAENYANLKDKERDYLDLNGNSSGAFVPTASLEGITSTYENGKLKINCKTPYQCGAFVNRFWGLASGTKENGGMPSSAADKEALVLSNGITAKELIANGNFYNAIVPGMAFVSKYGGTDHTGIVTATYPDGTYDTFEANIGDDNPNTDDVPRPNHRSLKDANLFGFAYPPKGTAQLQGGGGETSALTYGNAIRNSMQGKSDKIVDSQVNRAKQLLAAGKTQEAQNVVNSAVLGNMDTSSRTQFVQLRDSSKTFDKLNEMLDNRTNPSDFWFGLKGEQQLLAAIGQDDPQSREFQRTADIANMNYRKAMSGVAFSEKEAADYEKLFPSLDKTIDQNKRDMETLKNIFKQKEDGLYETASGGSFKSYDDLYKKNTKLPNQTAPTATFTGNYSDYSNNLNSAYADY